MNYPPTPLAPAAEVQLVPGERHLHTFRIRGWRYGVTTPGPRPAHFLAHFTDRRFLLIPLDDSDPELESLALPWSDVIEFALVGTSGPAAELPGAEEHMIHAVTKKGPLLAIDEWMLFTAEPVVGAVVVERPQHCAAFVEIADDVMVDAFEA